MSLIDDTELQKKINDMDERIAINAQQANDAHKRLNSAADRIDSHVAETDEVASTLSSYIGLTDSRLAAIENAIGSTPSDPPDVPGPQPDPIGIKNQSDGKAARFSLLAWFSELGLPVATVVFHDHDQGWNLQAGVVYRKDQGAWTWYVGTINTGKYTEIASGRLAIIDDINRPGVVEAAHDGQRLGLWVDGRLVYSGEHPRTGSLVALRSYNVATDGWAAFTEPFTPIPDPQDNEPPVVTPSDRPIIDGRPYIDGAKIGENLYKGRINIDPALIPSIDGKILDFGGAILHSDGDDQIAIKAQGHSKAIGIHNLKMHGKGADSGIFIAADMTMDFKNVVARDFRICAVINGNAGIVFMDHVDLIDPLSDSDDHCIFANHADVRLSYCRLIDDAIGTPSTRDHASYFSDKMRFVEIIDSIIVGGPTEGVQVRGGRVNIARNIIFQVPIAGVELGVHGRTDNPINGFVQRNWIEDCGIGISLRNCDDLIVSANRIFGGKPKVGLTSSYGIGIKNTTIEKNVSIGGGLRLWIEAVEGRKTLHDFRYADNISYFHKGRLWDWHTLRFDHAHRLDEINGLLFRDYANLQRDGEVGAMANAVGLANHWHAHGGDLRRLRSWFAVDDDSVARHRLRDMDMDTFDGCYGWLMASSDAGVPLVTGMRP